MTDKPITIQDVNDEIKKIEEQIEVLIDQKYVLTIQKRQFEKHYNK